jgi:hypothetical protein
MRFIQLGTAAVMFAGLAMPVMAQSTGSNTERYPGTATSSPAPTGQMTSDGQANPPARMTDCLPGQPNALNPPDCSKPLSSVGSGASGGGGGTK